MNIGTKKALGIITCKRPEFYQEIIDTTPFDKVDKVYVFDSSPENEKYAKTTDKIEVIPHQGSATVGFAKNRIWEKMLEDGMDHLYLQEGDIGITDENVFDLYLDTAKKTGIWGSLGFAWHGGANKDSIGLYNVKNNLEYDDGVGVDFVFNGAAAFTYHHAKLIKQIGFMDEFYQNAWEHLDHYQRVAEQKLGPYFWWFPDAKESYNYLTELDDGKLSGSVIRKDQSWQENMNKGRENFKKKFKFYPEKMPHANDEQMLTRMQFLVDNYSI